MEISLAEGERLKISLTPFDMIRYELTNDSIDYDNVHTRRVLWELFDRAKEQTGFDAADGKIKISVYPQKSGGCLIYITRVAIPERNVSEDMNYIKEKISTTSVYMFSGMTELISACFALNGSAYKGKSSAYSCENSYFLAIDEINERKPPVFINENVFLYEFGSKCHDEYALSYIKEHGICFCEKNAVKTLAELADCDV